jgi:hypothetical protein
MRLEVKAFADAPRDIVYRTLTDLWNRPRFVSNVEAVDMLSSGPIGIGTHYIENRIVLGRGLAIEFTIGDYDPPGIFVLTAEHAGVGFEVSYTLGYTGHETGITLELAGAPASWAGQLASLGMAIRKARLRGELEAEVGDIAREAERRYAERRTVIS